MNMRFIKPIKLAYWIDWCNVSRKSVKLQEIIVSLLSTLLTELLCQLWHPVKCTQMRYCTIKRNKGSQEELFWITSQSTQKMKKNHLGSSYLFPLNHNSKQNHRRWMTDGKLGETNLVIEKMSLWLQILRHENVGKSA